MPFAQGGQFFCQAGGTLLMALIQAGGGGIGKALQIVHGRLRAEQPVGLADQQPGALAKQRHHLSLVQLRTGFGDRIAMSPVAPGVVQMIERFPPLPLIGQLAGSGNPGALEADDVLIQGFPSLLYRRRGVFRVDAVGNPPGGVVILRGQRLIQVGQRVRLRLQQAAPTEQQYDGKPDGEPDGTP